MPDLPTRAAPDWDLVLKRNNVERLKRDKFPLEIKNEIDELVQFFLSERDYFDLPRKHKITISSCTAQCNAPEINCIVFIGTRQDGREGYALRVGGGLSSTPRLARDLAVFVPRAETREVA